MKNTIVLAHGYFKGSDALREQIRSGHIIWALGHLKETHPGRVTLQRFKDTWEWQKKHHIMCWDCRFIAKKLGLVKEGE